MNSHTFKQTMFKNKSLVESSYAYIRSRKNDLATALELNQPVRACNIGVIIGASVHHALSARSGINSLSITSELERIALINAKGNSVIALSIPEFEFYFAPYIIHALELIKQSVITSYNADHTHDCYVQQVDVSLDIALWKLHWPNHCQKCRGTSGFDYPATRDEPGGFDPCECAGDEEKPKCPRCGQCWPLERYTENGIVYSFCRVTDNPEKCPYCGWDWGNSPQDVMPEWPGCNCDDVQNEKERL